MADKIIAELKLKDVANMSYQQKLEIAQWLQKQAVDIFVEGDNYAYNFGARFHIN